MLITRYVRGTGKISIDTLKNIRRDRLDNAFVVSSREPVEEYHGIFRSLIAGSFKVQDSVFSSIYKVRFLKPASRASKRLFTLINAGFSGFFLELVLPEL